MRALLPLLVIAAPVVAQTTPPAAPPAAASATGEASGPVAVDDTGLRMTVPVTVAGAGPFAFLIDTGAQRTVISRELAQALGLAPGRSVRVTAMAGVAATPTVIIPALTISPGGDTGVRIEAPTFATENLGAAGLLGLDTLHDRRITIDLDARTISIAPAGKRRPPSDDVPGEIVVRARSRLGQLIVTDAYVDTVRVRVILDTGSVVTIGNEALRRRLAGRTGRITPIVL
ncbi:MAG: retropepsin-like aspartic protease, partial [Janthinobacterium lividum]